MPNCIVLLHNEEHKKICDCNNAEFIIE